MKILMVCLGNICRSPLAEGILRHKAKLKNLPISVDSAGTSGWHRDEAPDMRSIEVAKKHGIDISMQKSRPFSAYDFEVFDKIIVMDASNFRDVMQLASNKEEKQKVEMMLNYSYPHENRSVPDPYYDDNGFENIFQMLSQACDDFLLQIEATK